MIRTARKLLYLITFIILLILLSSCYAMIFTGLPSAKDYELIKAGKRSIVLLRVTCEVNGEPYEVFQSGLSPDDPIGLGLGGFETGGNLLQIQPKFLSSQTRKDGWLYFILEPGLYYLTAQPPLTYHFSSKTSYLWRLDVPSDVEFVYIGTLHLPSTGEKLLFGTTRISFIADSILVSDEQEVAHKIAGDFFPELKTFKTMLMARHKGPLILKTPKMGK